MREGNSFSLSTLVGGGGVARVTPSQVQMGEVPHLRFWMGGTPSQVQMGGGTPCPRLDGVPPLSKTGWGTTPLQNWMGYPPCPGLDGVPPFLPRLDGVALPPPNQQSEHLLYGGQCAFCIHAGGLSCLFLESIEHDFIKALMIHKHNQIVT